MRHFPFVISALIATTLAASEASASAILIQVDDSTPSVVLNVYKDGNLLTSIPENETFTQLGLLQNGTVAQAFDFRDNIFEPDGQTLSDTIIVAGSGTQGTITFDGAPLAELANASSLVETGDFQTVGTFVTVDANGAPLNSFIVQFRSELPAGVPEPLTLSIFSAGLVGVSAMRRRKAKSA